MPHALIVEDDQAIADDLDAVLRREGFSVSVAQTLGAARLQLERVVPDLILAAVELPDGAGTELTREFDSVERPLLVALTRKMSADVAASAMRAGAIDCIQKPMAPERLLAVLNRVPRSAQLKAEIAQLRDELRRMGRFGQLHGRSDAMQQLYDRIERVAPTAAPVLVIGEAGTGKELVARTIHELSGRRRAPFVVLDCGQLPQKLLERELFGFDLGGDREPGIAQRGLLEAARGGSIFLDEIAGLSADLQERLARAIEAGAVGSPQSGPAGAARARLIAAIGRSADGALAEGRLRDEFQRRLNLLPVAVPPLRDRGDDIELLAHLFLAEINRAEGTRKMFSPSALARLTAHPWPGNVRELKNWVHRAYVLADQIVGDPLEQSEQGGTPGVVSVRIGTSLFEAERRITMATLAHCNNVKRRAAEVLGISLKTLYNRLEAYRQTPEGAGRRRVESDDDDPSAPEYR